MKDIYLVKPQGERVPICHQKPLSNIKFGVINKLWFLCKDGTLCEVLQCIVLHCIYCYAFYQIIIGLGKLYGFMINQSLSN